MIDRDVHGQGHGSAASRGARGPTSTGVALAATLLLPATTSLTTAPPIVAPALAWGAPLAASLAAWPVAGRAADRRGGQRPPRPQQERVEQTRPLAEAQAALRARQPARALAITDQALKVVPNDSELRFTRGLALVALERGDEAEAVFRGLTQDFPELPEPYNNLAFILAARGDLDGARMALEQAVNALPDYAIAHENLGDIHLRLAARHFREASRLAGSNRVVAESSAHKLKLIENFETTSTTTPRSSRPQP